ncbi:helix-turn-helix transcriptional regulator [Streptomyces sp. NBC_00239]|uniref:helix-turn-helix transcriptional regulator n=1 Tax=Streptomyces sp. NBC_00239 TaxID=2903640 RepID=UPI002E2E444D|nr:helix-turn-helix transcriptional regulator [Streptomyces sp. NBC_00239]
MPRQFDGRKVRAVRRGRELSQKQLGACEGVGVSGPTVARWESGDEMPKGDKLPAIAAALGQPLDALFPHEGPADLQLLRCDAGLSVAQAAAVIDATRVPLANAESGRRRLQDAYVGPLADAYGVTREELLAAQDVSFGLRTARASAPSRDEQPSLPRTVAEKINYLLQYGYEGQTAPSDEQIAQAVNEHARAHGRMGSTTADDIAALREGATTDVSDSVRAGLAHALQVDAALFRDDEELSPTVREFLAAVRFFRSIQEGQILGLAARGNHTGLSAETMTKINEIVGELKHKLPGVEDGS